MPHDYLPPAEDSLWLASAIEASGEQTMLEAGSGSSMPHALKRLMRKKTLQDGINMHPDLLEKIKRAMSENSPAGGQTYVLQGDIIKNTMPGGSFDHTFAIPTFSTANKSNKQPWQQYASKQLMTINGNNKYAKWLTELLKVTNKNGTATMLCPIHAEQMLLAAARPFAAQVKIVYLETDAAVAPSKAIYQFTRGLAPMQISRKAVKAYKAEVKKAVLTQNQPLWNYAQSA